MATDVRSLVIDTFQQSQTAAAGHKTLALRLKHVYLQTRDTPESSLFAISFSRCVDRLLAAGKRDQCADRVSDFVEEFTKALLPEDEDEDEEESNLEAVLFFERLVERYIPGLESRLAQVRLRCLTLIQRLVYFVPLDESILQVLVEKAIARTKDADAKVRLAAVTLLARFEMNEEISKTLVHSSRHDPNSEVRLTATFNLKGISYRLTEILCERVRDTAPRLRYAMYAKVLPKVDFCTLSISTRERIVKAGLNDRDENVQRAAKQLVAQKWVSMSDNNIELVLRRLDVISNTEISDQVLQAFFELTSNITEKIDFDDEFFANIWVEDVVLLRGFQEYCNREKLVDLRESKMPDLTTIAAQIEKLWTKFEDPKTYENKDEVDENELRISLPFMVDQLLEVASKYDLSDEASRQRISQVTTKIFMADTAPTFRSISHIVAIQRQLNPSDNAFATWAFETLDATPAMSSQATSDTDLVSGLLRGLSLFQAVLSRVRSRDIASYLPSIYSTYIQQALQSPITDISSLGMKCLGLACLLDYKFAALHINFFINFVRTYCSIEASESAELVAFSVHAITDMLLQYEKNSSDETEDTPDTSVANTSSVGDSTIAARKGFPREEIVALFRSLLTVPAPATQHAAALSLAKLTLAKLVLDAPQILRLLLVYYFSRSEMNAANHEISVHAEEQHGLIQQQLLLFFRANSLYPDGRLDVARVFIVAFKDYAEWHERHPTAVSLGDFVRQVVELTSPDAQPRTAGGTGGDTNAHSVLAISLLELIIVAEDATTRRSLVSTLKTLELENATKHELRVIKDLYEQKIDIESIRGSVVKRELMEFKERLNKLFDDKPEEEHERTEEQEVVDAEYEAELQADQAEREDAEHQEIGDEYQETGTRAFAKPEIVEDGLIDRAEMEDENDNSEAPARASTPQNGRPAEEAITV